MVASDRLERVPLVGGLAAGDGASRRGQPRAAAGFVAGLVALVAVVALATGADAPAHALASLGKASGASMRGSTCESRVRAATADATFYAFDLFAWTPFSARGEREYTLDPPDSDVLAAKTTPAQFMYPEWLRAPLRADARRVSDPADADLLVVTDSLVDVSPFVAKFAWHATHKKAGRGDGWAEMDAWWDEKGGDAKGAAMVAEAGRRLEAMISASEGTGVSAKDDKKFLFMLPSEWMFGKEDVAEALKMRVAVEKALGGRAMTAVTDFDDGGPVVASVAATVPFATHSSIAAALLRAGGKVDYRTKKRGTTFFKGTGVRGLEGSLGRLTEARVALEALVGEKGHDVFLSSDDDDDDDDATGSKGAVSSRRAAESGGYAEGMLSSTFCWVPRGDNPTSRRIFDAVAAGCIPVVVSDDIARYLPFRWAVDWRAMILQVPEAIFARDPRGVAAAVLALPDAVVDALRERMDAARYKLLWNDRAAPTDPPCEVKNNVRRCSEAPRLYLDEMLFRAATGNAEPDAPLCERREGDDARFLDGSAWNAQGSCPPWLAMRGVCGEKAETKEVS